MEKTPGQNTLKRKFSVVTQGEVINKNKPQRNSFL